MIESIHTSDHSEVVLVVHAVGTQAQEPGQGRVGRLLSDPVAFASAALRGLFERLYGWLFERRAVLPPSEETVGMDGLVPGAVVLEANPQRTRWSDRYGEEDLERVRRHDVDVLVRLGGRILRGGVLQAARYGVWSYHHGDNLVNRGGPPAFWESMEGWTTTGSMLQVLTEDLDNGLVLQRSFSPTNAMSVLDNRRATAWKTLSFIPRKLGELHRLGGEEFFERARRQNADPILYSRPLYRNPGTMEYGRLLFGRMRAKARLVAYNLRYRDQWQLMFSVKPTLSTSFWRYERMVPPADRFWADPCAVKTATGYAIFIEEFVYAAGKGHIAVIEMDADGRWTSPKTVLERPYHLSYPFVFEYEGQHYMVPESAQNRCIEIYRCVEFPHRWELQETLFEGRRAWDSTILEHDGRFWLFATFTENDGAPSTDELFIYWSDRPVGGTWHAHLANPVISDCRSARPAGRLFVENGRLYRPSQDCSARYGWGFNIARVDRLDATAYEEAIVTKVLPEWADDVVATHTFTRAGDLHVIDAQVRRRLNR